MKKVILLLIICLLVIFGALTVLSEDQIIEPSEEDLSMEEAITIAKAEFAGLIDDINLDEKDCKATFLYFDINNEKKKVWIVCVFPCQNLRRNTLSAIIESPSGEVIHVDVKDAMDYMEDWERWGREEYWYWTAEEKAVYHMVYQMNPTRIFPDEDTMPQERALELAIKSVEDKYGISSDKINANFRVDYNLVPGWYGTIKEDAWYIVFRPQDKSAYNYQIIIKAKEGDAVIRTDRWIPEM